MTVRIKIIVKLGLVSKEGGRVKFAGGRNAGVRRVGSLTRSNRVRLVPQIQYRDIVGIAKKACRVWIGCTTSWSDPGVSTVISQKLRQQGKK